MSQTDVVTFDDALVRHRAETHSQRDKGRSASIIKLQPPGFRNPLGA